MSATTSIGRHVSGIADPLNGHIEEFQICQVQRSDGWIETQVRSPWQGPKSRKAQAASRLRWPAPVWWCV